MLQPGHVTNVYSVLVPYELHSHVTGRPLKPIAAKLVYRPVSLPANLWKQAILRERRDAATALAGYAMTTTTTTFPA